MFPKWRVAWGRKATAEESHKSGKVKEETSDLTNEYGPSVQVSIHKEWYCKVSMNRLAYYNPLECFIYWQTVFVMSSWNQISYALNTKSEGFSATIFMLSIESVDWLEWHTKTKEKKHCVGGHEYAGIKLTPPRDSTRLCGLIKCMTTIMISKVVLLPAWKAFAKWQNCGLNGYSSAVIRIIFELWWMT